MSFTLSPRFSDNGVAMPEGKALVLFDGVCNLCNSAVVFIISHDKNDLFLFASLQSEIGQNVSTMAGIRGGEVATIILVAGGRIFTHSTAVFQICRLLGGWYRLLFPLVLVPKFIRDFAYNYIAKHRYLWFGERESCMIPTPELRSKFLA